MRILYFAFALLLVSCAGHKKIIKLSQPAHALTGTQFYRQAVAYNWQQRDSLAVRQVLAGNMPGFLKRFVPVKVALRDSLGHKVKATFYVSPDYVSIGTDQDWARVPLTPMAAQQLADSLNCFLPTRKMVDAIYSAAQVKLEPVPLYAYRDSTPTFYHHHLMIEGQRGGKKGLIAGIKKDVVISGRVARDKRPGRVAIYGWHKPDGKPIQPLYTGHINWYVDYSHGIRLVYRNIKVNGRWMDYTQVLQEPALQQLLCDEPFCDFYSYPYQK